MRFFLLCMSLLILSACSGSGSAVTSTPGTGGAPAAVAAQLPPEPDRAANNATLAGIDSDGDGVRDDVQRLIFNTYSSATKRTLATALARETRKLYLHPPATKAEARKLADEKNTIRNCIYSREEIDLDERFGLIKLISAAHADTGKRMKIYLNYDKLLHGETFYLRDSEPGICNGVLP